MRSVVVESIKWLASGDRSMLLRGLEQRPLLVLLAHNTSSMPCIMHACDPCRPGVAVASKQQQYYHHIMNEPVSLLFN
jgi:hypothetical protein